MYPHTLAALVYLLLVRFITKHRALPVNLEYSLCTLTD